MQPAKRLAAIGTNQIERLMATLIFKGSFNFVFSSRIFRKRTEFAWNYGYISRRAELSEELSSVCTTAYEQTEDATVNWWPGVFLYAVFFCPDCAEA